MSNLDVSSISYTNLDFGSIYPDLLDLAKTLSNEWDPSASNESDPGVVLLKEAAFVGDHNNYHIDKNTLENFIQTATQDKSMRNIVELNGYTPRYYVAPTGKVSFRYTLAEGEKAETFIIPAFTLSISDPDENVSYLQAEDLGIVFDSESSTRSATSTATFIQGTLETLTVNGSNIISIENLDDNNRIYLPETFVAQNGLYVRYSSDVDHKEYGYWTRDNFMSTKAEGSRVFRLDFDSDKGIPYLEFPKDISNIINSGLIIKYISTSGVKGNVGTNVLTHIVSPTTIIDSFGTEHNSDNFNLSNPTAITNGKDPETLEEMYASFKKIVGTFNTLVTRKDYANRIYSLEDSYGTPYVSNAYVTDRNTDINKSCNVVSRDHNGVYIQPLSVQINKLIYDTSAIYPIASKPSKPKGTVITCVEDGTYSLWLNTGAIWKRFDSINLDEFSLIAGAMSPYDLCIYALKAFSMTNYNSKVPYRALESAYTPAAKSTEYTIKTLINEDKSINHNFVDGTDSITPLDVFCYKNYAPLNITLTPYYKVSKAIKAEITDNIYRALSEAFNPRTLEWGEALSILKIKEVILNCDDRIRDVNINPISYRTAVLKSNGEEVDFKTSADYFVDNITKNILAGRVCLFDFDDRFNLNYGQASNDTCDNIFNGVKKISTKLELNLNTTEDVKSSYTTETTTTSTPIRITANNYAYSLTNNSGIASNLYPSISVGNSQILKYDPVSGVGGVFKLCTWDKIETANTDATEYRATADKTYEISFNGATLVNSEIEGSFNRITVDGELLIKEISYQTKTAEAITNLNYTLKKNEAIQILKPNYYSDVIYSTNVYARYINTNGNITIPANVDYKLKAGEMIILVWQEDGIDKQEILSAGTVINSSFTLMPTDQTATTIKKKYRDTAGMLQDYSAFKQLSANNTISTRKMMTTSLETTALRCYWYVNDNDSNELFTDSKTERILNADEFFAYTNDDLSEMVIFGAGTKLNKSPNDVSGTGNKWSIAKEDTTTMLENIQAEGISAAVNWQTVNLAGKPLTITEMNVLSLGEGDNIIISGWSNCEDGYKIDNNFKYCNGTIIYTVDGNSTTLPATTSNYLIRSRLDINSSSDSPMELTVSDAAASTGLPATDGQTAVGAVQTVEIVYGNNVTQLITGANNVTRFIQTSKPVSLYGGDNIDMTLFDDIDMYVYVNDNSIQSWMQTGAVMNNQQIVLDYSDTALGFVGSSAQGYNYEAIYSINVNDASKDYIIPITIDGSDVTITATMLNSSGTNIQFTDYNLSNKVSTMILEGNSSYFLCPNITKTGKVYLKLNWTVSNNALKEFEIITVDNLKVVNSVNNSITLRQDIKLDTILARIKELISSSDRPSTKYFYTYDINDGVHMNLDTYVIIDGEDVNKKPIYSSKAFDNAEIFWDKHNLANELTIAQIDIRNSTVNIVSGMLGD